MKMKSDIRVIGAVCAVGLAALGAPAFADEADQEKELRNPTVVVTQTREDQAKAYMADIMPRGTAIRQKGLPRWNSELCVSVIGPPVEQGQMIADRIVQRALQVDLPAGPPGCETNLLIVVTDSPEELLPRIVKEHRTVFGDPGDPGVDVAGTSALMEFASEDRPVRWRQVIQTFSATGMPIDGDARPSGFGPPGPTENLPTVRASSASRLKSNVRREVSRMIVVVDTRETAGHSIGAISDYLAFVALTQVNADADMSEFPSIMNLFADTETAPRGMTDWDEAYLIGTYRSQPDAVNAKTQLREIRRLIVQHDPEARLAGS